MTKNILEHLDLKNKYYIYIITMDNYFIFVLILFLNNKFD